ncbi:MAG: prepilin-type N-terminal cleavage/methylation domain-containing protein [Fimbriimonadaceae bacterium]|nr:prepilin-type N-terminal cleavage/methylation domain-containing protein [Fimbriimonadaceae bacterium]
MKRGFTLIEVLTAIAIIAVLAGILFPVLSRARDGGRQTTCLSNLGQVGRAIGLYMADYDDVFPYAIDPSDRDRPEIWSRYPEFQAQIPFMPFLHDALFPYVKARDVFRCPADSGAKVLDSNFGIPFDTQGPMFDKYGTSYFFRTEIAFRYYTQDRFELPSQTNVLFDGAGHWHGGGKPMEIEDSFDAIKDLRRGYRYNVLYGDFHAKTATADQLDVAWQTRL